VAGTRTTNTFEERLMAVLKSVQDFYGEPEVDLEFVSNLETVIKQRLRAPYEAQAQSAAQAGMAPGQAPMGGGPAGPGMGPMPGGEPPIPIQAQPPQGMPPGRGRPGGGMPNPDELRRIMSAGG